MSTELARVANLDLAQLEATNREAEQDAIATRKIRCTSPEQAEIFAEVIREQRELEKAHEAMRKSATDLFVKGKRIVDSWFKPASKFRREVIANLKAALEEYALAADRTAKAAFAEATQLHLAGDFGAANVALTVANENAAVTAPAGVTVREVWVAEISQPDLVPREYCVPDVALVQARAPKSTEMAPPHIPGVTWSKQSRSTVR